jgi:1-acyl-sn-glycerol-3-phosphate acyltransferase
MLFARRLAFNILFVLFTALFSIAGTPALLLPYGAVLSVKQLWLRLTLGMTRRLMGIGWEERGRRNIPGEPVIFAVKHQSALDTLVLGFVHPTCVFVLKRELIWVPVWGLYLLRMGMIPIDRSKGIASLKRITEAAAATAKSGRSILIFPQGTRTPPGAERSYLPGVAAIYKGANLPVVPVALNSGLFWPKKAMAKQPGTVTVEYLEPIEPGLDRRTFMSTLESRIESATARLEQEALDRFPHLPRTINENTAAGGEANAANG